MNSSYEQLATAVDVLLNPDINNPVTMFMLIAVEKGAVVLNIGTNIADRDAMLALLKDTIDAVREHSPA